MENKSESKRKPLTPISAQRGPASTSQVSSNLSAPSVFELPFDGKTYDPALDHERLTSQLGRVFEAMKSGSWLTLAEVQALAGGSEGGISARIRDLRKPRFGGYIIERRRVGDPTRGLFEYRLAGRMP